MHHRIKTQAKKSTQSIRACLAPNPPGGAGAPFAQMAGSAGNLAALASSMLWQMGDIFMRTIRLLVAVSTATGESAPGRVPATFVPPSSPQEQRNKI